MHTAPSPARVHLTPSADGRTIEAHVSGKLSRQDYDRILPQLESLMQKPGKFGFVIVLEDFHGFEPAAAWADLRFDLTHANRFGRIAIVGENALHRWGTRLTSLLPMWTLHYFNAGDLVAAREWVREGQHAEGNR